MKQLTLIIMMITFGTFAFGQNNPKIIKAKKMFFAQELNLTMDQVESFWPIYMDMREALKQVAIKKNIKCSDPDDLKDCLNTDEEFVKTRNSYLLRIANIIGKDKAMRIPSVERDFINQMKQGIQDRS